MQRRDWKDPFDWFRWYKMSKGVDPFFRYTGGNDPRDFGGTFTRASTATYVDAAGVVQTAASGVPRSMHYDPANVSLGPTLLLEGSRQNLLVQSGDLTTTWTLVNPGSRARNATSPTGAANSATTITDDIAGNYTWVRQTFVVANDSLAHTLSVYVAKTTSAASFPGVGLSLTGGGVVYASAALNTDTGVATARTGEIPTTILVTSVGNFWRFAVTITNNTSGNTSLQVDILAAVNTDASATWNAATLGSAVFDCAQLEKAAFPSSYIPTTSASVTRAADALSFPFGPVPQAMTVYASGVDLGTISGGGALGIWSICNGAAAAERLQAASNGGKNIQTYHDNGSASAASVPSNAASYADFTETRSVLNANGSLASGTTRNSGTEVTASDATVVTLGASFSAATLNVNATGNVNTGFLALRSLKIAAGVQTLVTMRGV